ncbi:MAG: 4Fe-4S dicluster domain-containing protein [Anaerolineae bacterium]|jgi:formate dehydrogenase iron-sulfur subunit
MKYEDKRESGLVDGGRVAMKLSRREFLKLSGAGLGASVAGGALAPAVMAQDSENALGILYDPSKCIGCRACQMACKQWNELPAESNDAQELWETPLGLSAITWNIIKLRAESEPRTRFFNYQCMHCADAACVTACPSGALFKDENGFTAYDRSKCIGCGYCTQWCPYDVPGLEFKSQITGVAKAGKCTFCQDRIWLGIGGPSCAERCPVGALEWGPRAELLELGKTRVEELKAEGLSSARLYGETEAAGLGRLSILFDEPRAYNLPTDPVTPTTARIWQVIVQALGGLAIVGVTLGAFFAFLFSRGKIQMEEVE